MGIQGVRTKYQKLSNPIKVSFWFTVSNFIQKGIALITIPIITRMLTTGEYGTYSIFLAWSDILYIFTSLDLFGNSFNVEMKEHEKEKAAYTSSVCTLCILLTTICFLFYLIFRKSINVFSGLSFLYWLIMFIGVLLKPGLEFWAVGNRYDFKYKALVTVTLLIGIFTPLCKILLILLFRQKAWDGSLAAVIGNILPVSLVGLCLMILLFYRGRTGYVKQFWRFGLQFNLMLIPYFLSLKILDQSDRIMIEQFDGSAAAGIYSVAYSTASTLMILNSAINSSFIPWQFKSITAGKSQEVKKVINGISLFIALLNFLLIGFAPEILFIVAPKSYYGAIYIIPPIAISSLFRFIGQVFINVEFYYKNNRFTSIVSIVGALLNILLNYIFIPRFGYFAAGYTTLFCYILNALFHYLAALRATKREQEEVSFDVKFILLLSIAAVLISLLTMAAYQMNLLRYGIFLGILLLAIRNRKLIKHAWNGMLQR
jgi:O-antigen/teichoic acid export membrane protein